MQYVFAGFILLVVGSVGYQTLIAPRRWMKNQSRGLGPLQRIIVNSLPDNREEIDPSDVKRSLYP
jgi:hypothetical protein